VIGHGDWRAEHVRFLAKTPVVAFDWDSLCCEREPALIGIVANGFCADFSQGDNRQALSPDCVRHRRCAVRGLLAAQEGLDDAHGAAAARARVLGRLWLLGGGVESLDGINGDQWRREQLADPKHLGAQIGILSVLHTWGSPSTITRMNDRAFRQVRSVGASWKVACVLGCAQSR
jgi:hypothetical protein